MAWQKKAAVHNLDESIQHKLDEFIIRRDLPAEGGQRIISSSSWKPADPMRVQTLDVEAIGGLGDTCSLGIGSAWVLQIGCDATILVDGEHVTVRMPERQKEPREP